MPLKVWTPEMLARVRRDYPRCDDPHALAASLGVTYYAMCEKARLLGSIRRKPWTPEQREALKRLHKTHTAEQIATAIGRSIKSVQHMPINLVFHKGAYSDR